MLCIVLPCDTCRHFVSFDNYNQVGYLSVDAQFLDGVPRQQHHPCPTGSTGSEDWPNKTSPLWESSDWASWAA